MNLLEKAKIISYHRHRLANGSVGTEALGWRENKSQQMRFQILAEVGDLNNSTILDVGCGYGDLKSYLDQKYKRFTYLGVDQMPEFVAQAKAAFAGRQRTHFIQGDFTKDQFPQMDFVIACGAFGYRADSDDFHKDMIRKFYGISNKAFAFNMLDANTFEETSILAGQDSDKVLEYCRTLSSRVHLMRGYLKDDFTIFMYK